MGQYGSFGPSTDAISYCFSIPLFVHLKQLLKEHQEEFMNLNREDSDNRGREYVAGVASAREAKRIPYSEPRLVAYGAVGALTMGSGGTMSDGTMMDKK